MTVPAFSMDEFIDYLKSQGCSLISGFDDEWYDHGFLMMSYEDFTFPLQVRKTYFYTHTVKLCQLLGIPAPEDHLVVYEQIQKRHNKK